MVCRVPTSDAECLEEWLYTSTSVKEVEEIEQTSTVDIISWPNRRALNRREGIEQE